MAQLLPSIRIPTPWGVSVHLPALETPPFQLPSKPNEAGKMAIKNAIAQDVADIAGTFLELIPPPFDVAIDYGRDMVVDLHAKEIKDTLSPAEYDCYLNYNKIFPSTVAAVRCTCFKEVGAKAKGKSEGISNLIPMAPQSGPPLPQGLKIRWPKVV